MPGIMNDTGGTCGRLGFMKGCSAGMYKFESIFGKEDVVGIFNFCTNFCSGVFQMCSAVEIGVPSSESSASSAWVCAECSVWADPDSGIDASVVGAGVGAVELVGTGMM